MATFYGNIQKTSTPPPPPQGEALWKFENNLLDSTPNGNTLLQQGTIPFATSPAPPPSIGGTFSAGIFSDANFGQFPSAVMSAIDGNSWFFETYVYFNDLSNDPMIANLFIDTTAGKDWYLRATADGSFLSVCNFQNITLPAATIVTDTWYYIGLYTFDGSGDSKLYVSEADNISSSPAGTKNFNRAMVNTNAGRISGWNFGGSVFLDGYMKNTRIFIGEPAVPVPTD